MKSVGIGIVVAIAVALIGTYFLFFEVGGESIQIGVILSITGPGSYIGEQTRDGMQMAANEINSRGGIDGKHIELIFEDNQSSPDEAKKVFNKIEETYAPLFYVSSLSSISTAVAPLAEENKVVLIALSATAPGVTKQKEWTYRYFPTADDEVIPIMQILKDLNVNNLGILYQDDEFGRSILVAASLDPIIYP